MGNHNARVQRWLEFLTAFDYTLEHRKGSASGNADFLSRLPEPATEHDHNGSTSLNPVEDGGIYLIKVCWLSTPSPPIPGVGLGGLMPRTESALLGETLFTSVDHCGFRTHGPRMRIKDLSAPSGRFFARFSASVASIAAPAASGLCLQPTTISLRSSPYPPRSARALQKPLLPQRPSPRQIFQGLLHRGLTRSNPKPDRVRPCLAWLSGAPGGEADRISTQTRRCTATAADTALPGVDYGFGPGGAPQPSARRANPPPRVPRPRPDPPTAATTAPAAPSVPTVLITSDGDSRACGNSSLTAYASSWRHVDCTYKVRCPW